MLMLEWKIISVFATGNMVAISCLALLPLSILNTAVLLKKPCLVSLLLLLYNYIDENHIYYAWMNVCINKLLLALVPIRLLLAA